MVGLRHQGPADGQPAAAELRTQERGRVHELVEDERAVGAAAARRQDERFGGALGLPFQLRAAEVAAVVQRHAGTGVEPVLGEIEHVRVTVDADAGVAVPQDVVHARLLPQLAHEGRLVHHVAEAGDGAAALALEFVECGQ